MTLEQWIAAIVGVITICGAFATMAVNAWKMGSRYNQLDSKMEQLRFQLEYDFDQRMQKLHLQLKDEIINGPPWLQELISRQTEELHTLIKAVDSSFRQSQVAMDLVKQQGDEINCLRKDLAKVGTTMETILKVCSGANKSGNRGPNQA